MSFGIDRFVRYTIIAPKGAFLIPSFFELLCISVLVIITLQIEQGISDG